MTHRLRLALVSVWFMDFDSEDDAEPEDVRIKATSTNWVTEDTAIVETLHGQLTGLLGEPHSESIAPEVSYDAVKHLMETNKWPGQVTVGKGDA